MLSRKTLGVAGAAILGSMALLATNSANAVINLDPTAGTTETAGKVKIARETLLTNDTGSTTVKGVKYYHIANAGNALSIMANRGIVAGAAAVYYRLSFENMVLLAPLAVPTAEGGADVATVAGGAANDNHIVFSVAGGTTPSATHNITVAPTTLGVLPDMPANIKLEVYRNAFDAQAGVSSIASLMKMMSGAITVVDGISERGTPGTSVADVSTGFKQLTGGASMTSIGRLRITPDTTAVTQAAGAIDAFDDLLDATAPMEVTFKGDFSVGTYSLNSNMNCAADNSPTTVVDSTVGNVGDVEKAMLTPDTQPAATDTGVDWYLCLAVAENNDMALPTGAFTATVEYEALANAMGRAEQTVTVGSIARSGTTVHIPYLTTDERYNQRIVIVNRGPEATYSMTFESEDGIMAAAGMMASGTLAANSTKVLRATDVVTITGGPPHRVSAMLSIAAATSNISVATNQTTKMGGSTDTVVYMVK